MLNGVLCNRKITRKNYNYIELIEKSTVTHEAVKWTFNKNLESKLT
jgi:hypothetical protein